MGDLSIPAALLGAATGSTAKDSRPVGVYIVPFEFPPDSGIHEYRIDKVAGNGTVTHMEVTERELFDLAAKAVEIIDALEDGKKP